MDFTSSEDISVNVGFISMTSSILTWTANCGQTLKHLESHLLKGQITQWYSTMVLSTSLQVTMAEFATMIYGNVP